MPPASSRKRPRDAVELDGDAANAARLRRALSRLQPRKHVVRADDKASMLRVLQLCGGNASAAAHRISSRTGFEFVTARDLQRWAFAAASAGASADGTARRGRPVCAEFEAAVKASLTLDIEVRSDTPSVTIPLTRATAVSAVGSFSTLPAAANNIVYSYDVIRAAARAVRALPQWRADPRVARLAFSNKWVRGWLRRAGLRRLRVTSVEKVPPPAAAVAERMRAIVARIRAGRFAPCDVRSADETGVWLASLPKHQYVGAGVRRGTAPPADDHARFTVLLNGAADGTMHAPFCVVRCSAEGADLSKTRVLQRLRDVDGFNADAGWSLREWQRVLTTRSRTGQPTTVVHVRPYLVHSPSGAVITLNSTAWMRTAEVCMWADVQLAPQQAASGRPALIVVDNCGSHVTPAVEAVFREHGIALELLPKNMTHALQVMDLVANAPLKAALRRRRSAALFAAFQAHKLLQRAAESGAPWAPPKPRLADALRAVFHTVAADFARPSFRRALQRTFVAVGLHAADATW